MNIVIAGDGEVGFHLAELLSKENHNIVIVDPHEELLKMIESHLDLMTITGDSTSLQTLMDANIQKADLLISVLHNEQTNIITAILGKKLGAHRTIARINNPEYLSDENKELFKSLGIDYLVSPESIAAKEIVKLLNYPTVTEVFEFSDKKLSLFLLKLDSKSTVVNKTLNQVALEHPHLKFRAFAIHRNSKTIIPKGEDKFLENDLAYVISKPDGIDELLEMGGKDKIDIKSAFIIGGGRIGKKTALSLENDIQVKLFDIDKQRCIELNDILHKTLIINGDARDLNLLEEEGIKKTDAFIAVTDDSETNIIACMLAKRYGVKRTICLVENIPLIDIAQNMGIDTIINKKLIAASYIVRFTLRAEVTSTKCLNGIDAEVLEFVAKPNSNITKQKISEIEFPDGAIIGGIVRNNEGLIALGSLQIQAEDKVVVFALPNAIHKVAKLFN